MAAKNITANGATGNGATGAENTGNGAAAVTGGARPSGAAGDVWDALTADPGATVTAIAAASGVSRATVTRTLTALERDGRATRTRGGRDGGKRQPDTWHPVTTTGTGNGNGNGNGEDAPDASAEDAPAGEANTEKANTDEAPATTDTPDATEPADAEPTGADTGAGDGDAEDPGAG
ncbi:MarR family transcriptional regulator, partial [Actinomadura sp. GC306]|uniref:MarR family transcriptional regulator n=1 Tax=Actinomadura sp. GC306 TaxID=2530367 RepID=UPI0010514651